MGVIMRCDQCGTESPRTSRYDDDPDWFVVQQGSEDEVTLCSIGCLSVWATSQSIDQGAM